jgi:hypothetical protein
MSDCLRKGWKRRIRKKDLEALEKGTQNMSYDYVLTISVSNSPDPRNRLQVPSA